MTDIKEAEGSHLRVLRIRLIGRGANGMPREADLTTLSYQELLLLAEAVSQALIVRQRRRQQLFNLSRQGSPAELALHGYDPEEETLAPTGAKETHELTKE
jgi:hypothetical protein